MTTAHPLGIRERLLLSRGNAEARAEWQSIAAHFAEVLESGRRAEAVGDTETATACYGAMVAEMFEGSFPYERLRIIHAGAKQYVAATGSCQAFLNMLDAMSAAGVPSVGESKRQKFASWIGKYSQLTGSS